MIHTVHCVHLGAQVEAVNNHSHNHPGYFLLINVATGKDSSLQHILNNVVIKYNHQCWENGRGQSMKQRNWGKRACYEAMWVKRVLTCSPSFYFSVFSQTEMGGEERKRRGEGG